MNRRVPDTEVVLRLTQGESAALDALARGVGVLAERQVDRESALAAALDAGLVRLLDDFDLPRDDRSAVQQGLEGLRDTWARGNACL